MLLDLDKYWQYCGSILKKALTMSVIHLLFGKTAKTF